MKLSIQQIYDAARAAGFTPDQATTWTAIALYVRNLILNWLVILPALCLLLVWRSVRLEWAPGNGTFPATATDNIVRKG